MAVEPQFIADGYWQDFPDWASYYWSIGQAAALEVPVGQHSVTVLSVPTRAYAAALAAAGFASAHRAAGDHFDPTLAGRTVEVVGPNGENGYVGRCNGILELGGNRWFEITLANGCRQRFPVADRWRIVLTAREFNPNRRQIARPLRERQLLQVMLPGDPVTFLQRSWLKTLFVGASGPVIQELQDFRIRAGMAKGAPEGELGDLVRLSGFSEPWHARIARPGEELPNFDATEPNLVIFDSANTFRDLRFDRRLTRASWIVILDRSARDFDDGRRASIELFGNRLDDVVPTLGRKPPDGIEALLFRTRSA